MADVELKDDSMELREMIATAFGQVPYPGNDAIALHECLECQDIRRDFRRQSPWTIEASVLERRYDSQPLLSPQAFQYFLPAYMIYALGHLNSLVAQFTQYSLAPTDFDDWHRQRFSRFTTSQKASIIAFLEFMKTLEIEGDDEDQMEYCDKLNSGINIWQSIQTAQQSTSP